MYQLIDDENNENTNSLDKVSRDFLDEAINDYNKMFNTTYSTSSENFNNYYKDFSMRLKNRELDIAIVVNMFLTGFDSATLNTLWIDKKIRHHSLIQAMSRTNRILNDVKDHGNIVFFINLEDELNEAIKLFTDENNIDSRITILRPFKDYFYGYYDEKNKYVQGFKELVDILRKKFPDKCLTGYETKEEEKEFITTFGKILSYNNLLSQFAEFKGNELITGTELQDYKSSYIELNEKYRNKRKSETDSILFDIEFKIELIKSVEVNIDYILNFIDKHKEKDITKEIYDVIYKDILASPTLRKKKDLIDEFIASINDSKDPNEINTFEAWNIFIKDKQKAELQNIIKTKNLKSDETIKFMNKCFKDNEFNELGESIPKLLNMRKSFLDKNRYDNKTDVIETLKNHFNKFHIF
nr:hypothetical protein [Mycoplasmopsis primatum]